MHISAAHMPGNVSAPDRVIVETDDVAVTVPDLDGAGLERLCADLLAARAHLARLPVQRVIGAIDAAAARLLQPGERERGRVLRSLNAISGLSDPMAAHVLDRAAEDWRVPRLESLVRDELGGPEAIESFVRTPGGLEVRAVAPPLGLHVFAGNVPGVGVTSIVRALLVRSAVIAKPAAAEPVLTAAFARLLHDVDPEVGRCVAVTYWTGGDATREDAVLRHVDLVVHYGGADAIAALRARAPARVKFVEHGPRISFALIDASGDEDIDHVPNDLARAVALFDQQGCVSPQIAYVIGTRAQAAGIAAATAEALAGLGRELPRGRITPQEAVAIRELRTRAEFSATAGERHLWEGPGLDHTVILSTDPTFEGTCLNRTLLIKPVPDLRTIQRQIAPYAAVLQSVGLAGFNAADLRSTAAALADTGVTRVTSITKMPWPPPGWLHDGRGPLRELIRWTGLEPVG